jgi:pimeloyl-ACP methyl ester carboxylesterase
MAFLQDETVSDEEKTARQRKLWIEEYFPLSFADPEAGATLAQELFRDASFSWRHGHYSQTENQNLDIRDKLAAVTVPSLIVAGSHDMIPLSKAEEMDQGIPDSKLAVFENSGHYAPVEESDLFRKTFLEFIGAAE